MYIPGVRALSESPEKLQMSLLIGEEYASVELCGKSKSTRMC